MPAQHLDFPPSWPNINAFRRPVRLAACRNSPGAAVPVIGAIATATDRLKLGTGVTCPLMRMHPAIVAQAAATAAAMMPGRFFLGVGSGENYTVDNARVYACRGAAPGDGGGGREGHGRAGGQRGGRTDRYGTAGRSRRDVPTCRREPQAALRPADRVLGALRRGGAEARHVAHEWWPNAALPGDLPQELPRPRHFEQACRLVDEDTLTRQVVCSSDVTPHLEAIREFVDAGYDH
jgi:coenzyme F420-dependent glucose-6-phosphate dehydrogenase